jgi:hypothetical protein
LTDQLTQVIVTLGQQVRRLEEAPAKGDLSVVMTMEQVLLWSKLLDRLETKMQLSRQKEAAPPPAVAASTDQDVEAWRALHQAAQLIEQAMERKVPLAQIHALVECKYFTFSLQ